MFRSDQRTPDAGPTRRVTIPGLDDEAGLPETGAQSACLGCFMGDRTELKAGARFRLDIDAHRGDYTRAPLLHPEVFAAMCKGGEWMIGDVVRVRVERCGPGFAETTVVVGGLVGDRMIVRPAAPAGG